MPEMRLKAVVLPAPLGPISACRLRSRTAMSTPLHGACVAAEGLTRPPPRRGSGPSTSGPSGLRNSGSGAASDPCARPWRRPRRASGRKGATMTPGHAHQPLGREEDEGRRTGGRRRTASAASRSTGTRGRGGRRARPSAGPRKLRMPPITTMARSSPEKATESGSAEAKRWLKTDSVACEPHHGPPRPRSPGARSGSSNSPGTARAARSRGSPPAPLPTGERWKRQRRIHDREADRGDEPVVGPVIGSDRGRGRSGRVTPPSPLSPPVKLVQR